MQFYSRDEAIKDTQKGIQLLVSHICVSLLCRTGTDSLAVQPMLLQFSEICSIAV
jgi:hypothetical protein